MIHSGSTEDRRGVIMIHPPADRPAPGPRGGPVLRIRPFRSAGVSGATVGRDILFARRLRAGTPRSRAPQPSWRNCRKRKVAPAAKVSLPAMRRRSRRSQSQPPTTSMGPIPTAHSSDSAGRPSRRARFQKIPWCPAGNRLSGLYENALGRKRGSIRARQPYGGLTNRDCNSDHRSAPQAGINGIIAAVLRFTLVDASVRNNESRTHDPRASFRGFAHEPGSHRLKTLPSRTLLLKRSQFTSFDALRTITVEAQDELLVSTEFEPQQTVFLKCVRAGDVLK